MFARHFFTALFLALAALVSACQSPGNGYLMNGIGAELPARDIESATTLQRKYFNHLCIQAGLGDSGCALDTYDGRGWSLVVQQGMNDIDRRCDAYLEWLDNQHRGKGPLLSQISSIQGATTAIMGLISPGSGAALSIVGEAFGLLRQSVENYHSRLLIDIEPSTRNSVVLRALHDFRVAYGARSVANKPEAEYVLREYLRRCLPFAIETQINDLSTLGSRGIRASEDNSIFVPPSGLDKPPVSQPLKPGQKFSSGASLKTNPKPDDRLVAVFPDTGFGEPDLRDLQVFLCLPPEGFAGLGPQLRLGISLFEATPWNPALGLPDKVKDGKISSKEWKGLVDGSACDPDQFRNYYEKELFATPVRVTVLVSLLNRKTPGTPYSGEAVLSSPELREKISQVRLIVSPEEFGPGSSDQLTPAFVSRLRIK